MKCFATGLDDAKAMINKRIKETEAEEKRLRESVDPDDFW
jgi:hypothetical protein